MSSSATARAACATPSRGSFLSLHAIRLSTRSTRILRGGTWRRPCSSFLERITPHPFLPFSLGEDSSVPPIMSCLFTSAATSSRCSGKPGPFGCNSSSNIYIYHAVRTSLRPHDYIYLIGTKVYIHIYIVRE